MKTVNLVKSLLILSSFAISIFLLGKINSIPKISADYPLKISQNGTISIDQFSGSNNGYLTLEDWLKLSKPEPVINNDTLQIVTERGSITSVFSQFTSGIAADVRGNSSTASRLFTSRKINGVEFDGSKDITLVAQTMNTLYPGLYIVGNSFNGLTSETWSVDSSNLNIGSKIVARDLNGDFSARNITGTLIGYSSLNVLKVGDTMTGGLVFSGVTNDISSEANDNIAIMPGGTGKVGIGTVSPTATLSVNGSITGGENAVSLADNNFTFGSSVTIPGSRDNDFASGSGKGFGPSGQIYAIAKQTDGKTIIGGSMTSYNGTSRKSIARVNLDGTVDTSFDVGSGTNSIVYSIAIQTDGKVIIGGTFSDVDGNRLYRLARLNSDGSIDPSFYIGTGFNDTVNSISIQSDGKILVGGEFTVVNGKSCNYIARLNSDGSVDTSFEPVSGASALVYKVLALSDGKILISGSFTTYDGVSSNRIAKLNSDGTLDTSFILGTGASNYIRDFVLQSDGKIVIVGNFTSYNGTLINRIARLNTDGTLDTSFGITSGANGIVYAVDLDSDGKIYVGGSFSQVNGSVLTRVSRLNADGSVDSSYLTGTGFGSTVYDIVADTQGAYYGGFFTTYNGLYARAFTKLNSDGTLDLTFNVSDGFDGTAYSVAVQSDNKVLVGGSFTHYGTEVRSKLARLNTDGTLDSSFNVGDGANNTVVGIAVQSDGKILVTGDFTTYNGVSVNRIMRLNTDGTLDSSFNTGVGANLTVQKAILQSDGKIILIGDFTSFNGVSKNRIVRLNTDGSFDPTFNIGTGFNFFVYDCIIQSDGKLVLGGNFTSYNGNTSNRLARLNTDGSFDSSFITGTGFNTTVYALVSLNTGDLIAGGGFSTYNGNTVSRIVKLSKDGIYDASFLSGSGFDSNVTSLYLGSDSKIYVGGNFVSYNGTTVNRIARLLADGTLDESFVFSQGANSSVLSIAEQSAGKIIVAGSFVSYNGYPVSSIVRVNMSSISGVLENSVNASVLFGTEGVEYSLSSTGMRYGYKSESYLNISEDKSGKITFDAVGPTSSFEFLDDVSIDGSAVVTGSITSQLLSHGGIVKADSSTGRFSLATANDVLPLFSTANTSSPTLITKLTFTRQAHMLKQQGSYLYVSFQDQGLAIVDVTDTANPKIISEKAGPGGTDPSGVADIFVNGQYAYVLDYYNKGIVVWDVSDPANPFIKSSFVDPLLNCVRGADMSGTYLFTVSSCLDDIRIFDLSDPNNLVSVGYLDDTQIDSPKSIRVSGDYLYVTGVWSKRLSVIDIHDKSNPQVIGSVTSSYLWDTQSIDKRGNYIYATSGTGTNGFVVIDVSNPHTPVVVSGKALTAGWTISVQGRIAWVGSYGSPGKISQIDVTNPMAPILLRSITVVSSSTLSTNPYAYGNTLYVSNSSDKSVTIYSTGGGVFDGLDAGLIFANGLSTSNGANIGGSLYVNNGISVGQNGLMSGGNISIAPGNIPDNASALSVHLDNNQYSGNAVDVNVGTDQIDSVYYYDGLGYTDNGVEANTTGGTPYTILDTADSILYVGNSGKFSGLSMGVSFGGKVNSEFVRDNTGSGAGGSTGLDFFSKEANTLVGDSAITLLTDMNDRMYVGNSKSTFTSVYVDIETPAVGMTLSWQYWNGSAWTALTVVDGTNGFANDGVISFTLPVGWISRALDSASSSTIEAYWIRATTSTITTAGTANYFSPKSPIIWEYWNGSAWTQLTSVRDSSEGFAHDGDIKFGAESSWVTNAVNGVTNYWIRIRSPFDLETPIVANYTSLVLFDGNYLNFSERGVSKFTVDSSGGLSVAGGASFSGNVGIGVSNPLSKFVVQDNITTTVASFQSNALVCDVIAGTGWSCSSDQQLKENIIDINSALASIQKLRPVTFAWKANQEETAGFIAQEVQEVFPGLVTKGSTGYLGVNKEGMTPYIVKAIQEQQVIITAIQEKQTLDNAALNSEIELIKGQMLNTGSLDNSLVAGALTVSGNSNFAGSVVFDGDVLFKSNIRLNGNNAGVAEILAGETEVKVMFVKPFESIPVVNITPISSTDVSYHLVEVTKDWLIIRIDGVSTESTRFNWIAL